MTTVVPALHAVPGFRLGLAQGLGRLNHRRVERTRTAYAGAVIVPPDPPLGDGSVLLRLARDSDVPDIVTVYSDPSVRHWMLWDDEAPDQAEARANIARSEEAWAEGSHAVFRIVDRATDRLVGGVSLQLLPHDVAELSYFLHTEARGRGLATRAVRLVCRWGFDTVGLHRIFLRCQPANTASIALAERCGFQREGLERSSAALADGTRVDAWVYALLPR